MKRLILFLWLFGSAAVFAQEDQSLDTTSTIGASSTIWNHTWHGVPGRTYFLKVSTDLVLWNYLPVLRYGENTLEDWSAEIPNVTARTFWKLRYVDEPTTDAFTADYDGDGLTNQEEIFGLAYSLNNFPVYTDPLSWDTDGDGMEDLWEIETELNPADNGVLVFNHGPNGNQDNDGLLNLDEYLHDGDPRFPDTDGDGLSDGAEYHVYHSLVNVADSDGDGVTDGIEVSSHGSDPTKTDTDGDGLTDYEEVNIHQTNPTSVDSDGDSITDGEDAMPKDALVDWPKTLHYKYAVIPLPGDMNDPGPPVDVNDDGLVVFARKYWRPETNALATFPAPQPSFSLTLPRADGPQSYTMSTVVDFAALRTTNAGHVVGWARISGTGPAGGYTTYRGLLWTGSLASAPTIIHPSAGAASAGYYYPHDIDDSGQTAGLEAVVTSDAAASANSYVKSNYGVVARSLSGTYTVLTSYPALVGNLGPPRPPYEDGSPQLDPKVALDSLGKLLFRDIIDDGPTQTKSYMRYLNVSNTVGTQGNFLTDVAGLGVSASAQRVAAVGNGFFLRADNGAWQQRTIYPGEILEYPLGASKINGLGQALIGEDWLWQNGVSRSLTEHLFIVAGDPQAPVDPKAKATSKSGTMAGTTKPGGGTEKPALFVGLNILADTNRDGKINGADEAGKLGFTKPTGNTPGKGAIILANCDDDDGDKWPDNWPGAIPGWHTGEVDRSTNPTPRAIAIAVQRPGWLPAAYKGDYIINGATDLQDLARFRVQKVAKLPDNCEVRLRVDHPKNRIGQTQQYEPETEPAYFTRTGYPGNPPAIEPKHRVRIFLPTEVSGDNLVHKTGDFEVIGPAGKDTVTFASTPDLAANKHNISILRGTKGYVEFAVEGIEMAAMVDVWLECLVNGNVVEKDKIRLKCAPFIAVSNNQPVEKTLLAGIDNNNGVPTPFNPSNAPLNQAFDAADGIATSIWQNIISPFPQDEYEIGYTEMPGPNSVPIQIAVMLDLLKWRQSPHNQTVFGNPGMELWMNDGVGVVYRFNYLNWGDQDPDTIQFGGNIECSPPVKVNGISYPFGRIVVGNIPANLGEEQFNSDVLNFLKAQEMQSPVEVSLPWSDMRHVDEFFTFVPNANTANPNDFAVLLASPAKAELMLTDIKGNNGGNTVIPFFTHDGNSFGWIAPTIETYLAEGYQWKVYNATVKNAILGPGGLKAELKDKFGLADAAFIEVPQLFGKGEANRAVGAQVSLVNLQIVGNKAFLLDTAAPYSGPLVNGKNVFTEFLKSKLAALGLTTHFLPYGEIYVVLQAGMHCASNKIPKLTPQAKSAWWNSKP